MPATDNTVLYDIQDCKVYALLTDTVGASPTYGAAQDVPGINGATMNPNLVTAEIKGDGVVYAKKGKIDRFKGDFSYAAIDQSVLAVIAGGVVTAAGTDPTASSTWSYSGGALPTFKIEFAVTNVDFAQGLQAAVVKLYKCQLTGATFIDQKVDAFGQPTFSIEAYKPTYAATPMADMILTESFSGLSA